MTFLDEVCRKREKLADVLADAEYAGIRRIVEELYPDKAHFIYELLQNAEDASATDVLVRLEDYSVTFEHNGRPFTEQDVLAITNIGQSAKESEGDQIGKFGVGFKAVFAYTETPRIWSPTFSFELKNLVLPRELPPGTQPAGWTRIELPFNSAKKTAAEARAEVEAGLRELSEMTLLFLSNIEGIRWEIAGGISGVVLRVPQSEHHVEILRRVGDENTRSAHFLRFTSPLEVGSNQFLAVAFELDPLDRAKAADSSGHFAERFRIAPANPGRVAVFFPAEKETSGLRFHLHAPFVPELSRASIKDTPANTPLFDGLAELVVKALFSIRDHGLLSAEFLSVLPNPKDEVRERYVGIRGAIVAALNEQPLTPTYNRGHAPARRLLQARASLKSLLSTDDLMFLRGEGDERTRWAVGATQTNSDQDRFLAGLDIEEWNVRAVVGVLLDAAGTKYRRDPKTAEWRPGEPQAFISWLSAKPDEWVQRLYALLNDEALSGPAHMRVVRPEVLGRLYLVRLLGGRCGKGKDAYFPAEDGTYDDILPTVDPAVFSSGRSKAVRDSSRQFLSAIGVRELDERGQVDAILRRRYGEYGEPPGSKRYRSDLKRFVALVESDPEAAQMFEGCWIFECCDAKWRHPSGVFLDEPLFGTGLTAYYEPLGEKAGRVALSNEYINVGISRERLVKFAEAVGAAVRLEVEHVSCVGGPSWKELESVGGERFTSTGRDDDYTIPHLSHLIRMPSEGLARAIWVTLARLPSQPNILQAHYGRNLRHGYKTAPSRLAHLLSTASWVPQRGGPFVRPADAVVELLPEGFIFDAGWQWVKDLGFGANLERNARERKEREDAARKLGFQDTASLNDAAWFARLDPSERARMKQEYESRQQVELPESYAAHPERRATRLMEAAAHAPARLTEERTRSVSVERDYVKKETKLYLTQQYTNTDGQMICQVCANKLPFTLKDGTYYFEAVEFIPKLTKYYYWNYLALCPNHAAMFMHANESEDNMRDMFQEMSGERLPIVLAGGEVAIYFTRTHVDDLRQAIEADGRADGAVLGSLPASSFVAT